MNKYSRARVQNGKDTRKLVCLFFLQGDLCLKVEEHVLCVEMRVDAVLSNLKGTGMGSIVI